MPAFPLVPIDEDVFDPRDPNYHSFTMTAMAPAEKVWAELHGGAPLWWCRGIRSARWTSPEPFGVGTTRDVTLSTGATVHERYFVWDETRHRRVNAFTVETANVPLFRRFGERYTVVPMGDLSRFTWEFYIEPRLPQPLRRPAARLVARDIARLRDDCVEHFVLASRRES